MAALSPLAFGPTPGAASLARGFAAPPLLEDPVAAPPSVLQPPQLLVVNGRLVVAASVESQAGSALAGASAATPQVDTPDSAKSLAQAIASENGPSAAPPPPTRAALEAQLASLMAQTADAQPNAPESTSLHIQEALIRQALAELTIAPGSYGTYRANLRGLATDKVA